MNVHDNGWLATASENLDGTFSAWAAPDAPDAADYIEDCPENAMRAAEFALRQKSGHERCSKLCTGWRQHHRELDANARTTIEGSPSNRD